MIAPLLSSILSFLFFFNDTATTEIYTLSLHDALPISSLVSVNTSDPPGIIPRVGLIILALAGRRDRAIENQTQHMGLALAHRVQGTLRDAPAPDPCVGDRKSTRLNSSHLGISYAVFCF